MFFGKVLFAGKAEWFSGDGKELRGSILKGDKRGDAIVQFASHQTRDIFSQAFYNGTKESEIPCIRQLLEDDLGSQNITLDALHLNPETTSMIAKKGGHYLIGLKENQKELYDDMEKLSQTKKTTHSLNDEEKGHGRVSKWEYKSYEIGVEYFDERWNKSNFQTLVKVDRTSYDCKTKKESSEVSYYVSNFKTLNESKDVLFKAVRNHWKIETNNHVRDVTFKEDNLKTKETIISKILACGRTFAINTLNKKKLINMRAQLESFADDFQMLMRWLSEMKVL